MSEKAQDGKGGEHLRKRRALAVGALMGHLVEPLLAKQGAQLALIIPHWRAICPLFADHSIPESVRGRVLTVAVASDSVKQEMQYMALQIVEGVNRLLGYDGVEGVKCITRSGVGKLGR